MPIGFLFLALILKNILKKKKKQQCKSRSYKSLLYFEIMKEKKNQVPKRMKRNNPEN